METFQRLRDEAKKKILIADHMLVMTYPVVNDPKLLLQVLENILKSLQLIVHACLEYERIFKRIPPYPDTLEGQLLVMQNKLANKYRFTPQDVAFIKKQKELLISHKESPVEFVRKDKFVISDERYNLKTLSMAEMKKNIATAKGLIGKLYQTTTENDRIFR